MKKDVVRCSSGTTCVISIAAGRLHSTVVPQFAAFGSFFIVVSGECSPRGYRYGLFFLFETTRQRNMQKMKQRIQHSASNFSTPPEKMLSDWAAAVAGGAMIVTMYCWLLRVAMAFVESMTCQQIPLRKPASGKGMTASQIEEQEFDQCVLQRPCRFLGRHGRTTSTLTATNIAYNVVQSWRILIRLCVRAGD